MRLDEIIPNPTNLGLRDHEAGVDVVRALKALGDELVELAKEAGLSAVWDTWYGSDVLQIRVNGNMDDVDLVEKVMQVRVKKANERRAVYQFVLDKDDQKDDELKLQLGLVQRAKVSAEFARGLTLGLDLLKKDVSF